MPSPNPNLTPIMKLPSPLPADPPDVPGDIKALADAIEQWHKETSTTWGPGTWNDAGPPVTSYRTGNLVVSVFNAQRSTPMNPSTGAEWSQVPSGYRPANLIYINMAASTGADIVQLQVEPSGSVKWTANQQNVTRVRGHAVWITGDPKP